MQEDTKVKLLEIWKQKGEGETEVIIFAFKKIK